MKNKLSDIKVLVAKSDKLLCDFICDFVTEKGLTLVGQASKGADALKILEEQTPDLIIVGADLSGFKGLDLVAYIHENNMPTQSILFSRDKSESLITKAQEYDISGILFFDDGQKEFFACLHSILNGNNYRSPQFERIKTQADLKNLKRGKKPSMIQNLGKIELKVLWLVSQHLSIKQIGEKLFISHHTVNNHQSNIRRKLHINGRSSLLKYALAIKDRFIEANDRVWIKPES